MDWAKLKDQLANQLVDSPQRSATAAYAVAQIEDGCHVLSRLGYRFVLAEEGSPSPVVPEVAPDTPLTTADPTAPADAS